MTGNRLESWREVWERKGREARDVSLQGLIAADGFDGGAGKMTEEMWHQTANNIARELDLKPGDFLLEVGCGSGAMLLPLSSLNIKVAGIDYSATLVALAQKALPRAEIKVSEARRIPWNDRTFSQILAHSVFQYFPNYDYTESVLLEMLRVLRDSGRILIMDVPDLATKVISEQKRKLASGAQSSEKHSGDDTPYSHLYYPRSFFKEFAGKHGLKVKVFDQKLKDYGNALFRR